MRWLTGLVVVLGCLWCGYWFIGARGFEAGAEHWFTNMEAAGKVARYQALDVNGFPNRFDLTVTEPQIGDPASGITWQAPFLQVLSLSYKPWHVIAAFPPTQQITLPYDAVTVQSGKLQASVVVQPVPTLPLDRSVVIGEDLVALGESGWDIRAASMHFATRLDATRADMHEIGVEITGLQPDARLTAALGSVLPDQISLLRVGVSAGFTAPIDRMLLQSRPQITQLVVNDMRMNWGDLHISAKGQVIADATGFAEGTVTFRLVNWRLALDAAQRAGFLAPNDRALWEKGIEGIAFMSQGNTTGDTVDLPIQFKGGAMLLGPLPIGPAPRLR